MINTVMAPISKKTAKQVIDLHSHILFGLDDGARTLDDSLELARHSVEQGVTHMMCTPHINQGVFDNTAQQIEKVFTQTCEAIKANNIPLVLSHSCEVRICPELINWIKQDELYFIGMWQEKSALLLELPHSHIPAGVEKIITWLSENKIQVIIPHPERNREILADYKKAIWLRRHGVLFQATAGALVGRFSTAVESCAWRLLEDGFIDYVASDLHNLHKRPNDMKKAYNAILKRSGGSQAKRLCLDTPKELTRGIDWT